MGFFERLLDAYAQDLEVDAAIEQAQPLGMSKTMRCKMTLHSITESIGTVTKFNDDGSIAVDDKGKRITEQGPTYSLKFGAVYHNDDPKHENTRFWAYSPSGTFELNTVNPKAVEGLEVGKEYYVDVTPAG